MKAKCKKLYSQSDGIDYGYQFVLVKLCSWNNGEDFTHYTLEKIVVLDGEDIVKSLSVFDWTNKESELIRLAIKTFDELKASHPILGEK